MFTKIAKVILWIGLIAGFVGSIVLGVSIGENTHNDSMTFPIMLIGWVVTFVEFALLGVLVEISSNIAESRDLQAEIKSKLSGIELACVGSASPDVKAASNYRGGTWICPNCDTLNSEDSRFCSRCKSHKPRE